MSSSTSGDSFENVDASTTSNVPVQITNSLSLAACLAVIISYFLFRRKNKRIMERTSLVLAVSMAFCDGLLHCINLFGYSDLPHNFICSFFGGFLYGFPTLVSVFYSVCIALNTSLVFVFNKRPGTSTLKYYIGAPILLALIICLPALATGTYGYDASWDLCWYATEGKTPNEVLIRYLFTFGLWCLVSMLYLVVAAISILIAVFSKSSRLNRLANSMSSNLAAASKASQNSSNISDKRVSFLPDISATGTLKYDLENGEPVSPYSLRNGASQRLAAKVAERQQRSTLSRRSLAMRALSFRLIGYILVPTLCILPGVIKDLVSKVDPEAINNLPDQVSTFLDSVNGLVGLLNMILYAVDPALLALYHQLYVDYQEGRAQRQGDAFDVAAENGDPNQYATYPPGRRSESSLSQPPIPGFDTSGTYKEGEKVEVRSGKFLPPIRVGGRAQRTRKMSSMPNSAGIVIRVEVEVVNDLERLGDFLGGL
ncbi:hypothetical protein M408DRAFT_67003 [Serendipita vermifera MAFF 305830]|uniref:G-protein coupled receptors family 2 profile 2 domain-containing protein n=1 Tax=Serendipita vermifera MAFF 305830 TaxID=933852 RepID=A0A0C2WV03_SERVB|nr:hypothetical protein M408DRAFT_67003 [Serendipita vermifera MAFF 305830]